MTSNPSNTHTALLTEVWGRAPSLRSAKEARASLERAVLGKGEFKVRGSGSFLNGSFLDFARADARGANTHLLFRAVHQAANGAQIRIPTPTARIVCVTDDIPKMRPFAAQCTLHRHKYSYSNDLKIFKNASLYSTRPAKFSQC